MALDEELEGLGQRVSFARTRPGLHLRAVGEYPAAADALGIDVYRLRYLYVIAGGALCGLAGATLSLAISPGWFSEKTTGGLGWIAIGLVIFAQWDPFRAAFGSLIFGALRRLILDLQGPQAIMGIRNPFYFNPYLGFFLQMLPFAFTIAVLVIGVMVGSGLLAIPAPVCTSYPLPSVALSKGRDAAQHDRIRMALEAHRWRAGAYPESLAELGMARNPLLAPVRLGRYSYSRSGSGYTLRGD